jgi:hypothetical protein
VSIFRFRNSDASTSSAYEDARVARASCVGSETDPGKMPATLSASVIVIGFGFPKIAADKDFHSHLCPP